MILCISSVTLKLAQDKKKTNKQENTANKHNGARPKDLRGSAMCLHPQESAAHHHDIDHEIKSSIQAATSFDLSLFLFSKPQSPSSLPPL